MMGGQTAYMTATGKMAARAANAGAVCDQRLLA
jgi:hypothetical protein